MTNEEWQKRLKALREAEDACVLPPGTRVRITVNGEVSIVEHHDPQGCIRVRTRSRSVEPLTHWRRDDVEAIDEPEAPKWLRPGMVVLRPDGEFPMIVTGAESHLDDHVVCAIASHGGTASYPTRCLKPYVPQFQPGDRVVLATTGDVGTVRGVRIQRGTVSFERDGEVHALPVSAHLLTKLEADDA